MDALRFGAGVLLPYVALLVFLGGMIHRVHVWRKLPSPPITLFPAPATAGGNTLNALREAFLFAGLLRGDRLLWLFAWAFHVVLALIFLGHLRVFTNLDRLLLEAGMSEANIRALSSGAGGAAGIVIAVTAFFLLLRRMLVRRAREISGLGDYFALLLIGAVLITGNMMRFGAEHFDLGLTRAYFAGLATLSEAGQAAALHNNLFLLHLGLACVLIMLMPFSKLLHFGGIFFTHQLIRKH